MLSQESKSTALYLRIPRYEMDKIGKIKVRPNAPGNPKPEKHLTGPIVVCRDAFGVAPSVPKLFKIAAIYQILSGNA